MNLNFIKHTVWYLLQLSLGHQKAAKKKYESLKLKLNYRVSVSSDKLNLVLAVCESSREMYMFSARFNKNNLIPLKPILRTKCHQKK